MCFSTRRCSIIYKAVFHASEHKIKLTAQRAMGLDVQLDQIVCNDLVWSIVPLFSTTGCTRAGTMFTLQSG